MKKGALFLNIVFDSAQESLEVVQYLQQVQALSKRSELRTFTIKQDENRIQIEGPTLGGRKYLVQQGLYSWIWEKKRIQWCHHWLEHHYYFTDEEERSHILHILWEFTDTKSHVRSLVEGPDEEQLLREALESELIEDEYLHFRSFVTFRLRKFQVKLREVVELAIDEYKLEQDYQMFVESLRNFLRGRSPVVDMIHLVQDEGFLFFDASGRWMKQGELYKSVDRKLIVNHPAYIDSVTIAPLLSIAPRRIRMYTDAPDEGIARTICTIFDERVEVYPRQEAGSLLESKRSV